MNNKLVCILFSSDDYKVELDIKSTDTIHDLKLKFEEEEGIPPEHQSYFSGPVELEDETLVSTLVEVFGDTLDVKLRKAATVSTNQDQAYQSKLIVCKGVAIQRAKAKGLQNLQQ